jgi:hypothetical protein
MIKYAIIIGINYKGSSKYLPGCMNDVITIYKTLINWGFQTNNIIVLADDIQKSDIIKTSIIQPTSFNINQSLGVFVKQFKTGDSGVIYYTGHGMRTKIGNKRIEGRAPIYYKVDMDCEFGFPMALIDQIKKLGKKSHLIKACMSEYWTPTFKWKYLEFLCPSMLVIEILPFPESLLANKGRMNYNEDMKFAKQLYSE